MRPTRLEVIWILTLGVCAVKASPLKLNWNFFVVMSAPLSRPYLMVFLARPKSFWP